jgi:hypothetical protein
MASSFLRIAWSERSSDSRLWIAVALSILLHAMSLATWPALRRMLPMANIGDPDQGKRGGTSLPITARIVLPAPAAASLPSAQQEQSAQPAPRAAPAPRPAPVIATERARGPAIASPKPETARTPGASDFLADIAARRGSRQPSEAPAPPAQSQAAASAPLSFGSAGGAGGERNSGGYFLVERMTVYDATLSFHRWNRGVQRLEVPRENNLSIQLAVIKQVIALMRENGFSGDVNWISERLGRTVEISARERDQVKLEAFLMLEFFSADPLRRPSESFQR